MLKKHRKIWIHKQDESVDLEKFTKNGRKLLNTFLSLGPVYIKLGQWLSSRADILPQPYMKELEKLQDNIPAAPFEKVKPILERDLGSVEGKFDFFDHDALAGASLGQVYRAKINNKEVVVKVKRPGIEEKIKEDIKVLEKFLPIGLRFIDPNLGFSAKSVIAQFIESIHEEIDYTLELANLKKIKWNLRDNDRVIIPSVYEEYSSKNVITMEYLPGIKITDIKALDEKKFDRKKLVLEIFNIFFTMLLRDPIFHADPHPGNISVSREGKIILYDYGMIGRLDKETRMRLIRVYLGLIEKDPSRTVNGMEELGMLKPGFNRILIEKAISMSIRSIHGQKPDEVEVKSFMELANKTMGRFPFLLPKELASYLRMASILEGIYETHNIEFRFAKVLRAILEKENLVFRAYVQELKHSFNRITESVDTAISLAPELKRFLDDRHSLEETTKKRNQNLLLSGSILSSAVFVGSAVLFSANELAGTIGMISSGVIMGIFIKFTRN